MTATATPQPVAPKNVTRDDKHAFPSLSDDQIRRACKFGEKLELGEGHVVFARGEREVDFFIVLDGCIEIYNDDDGPTSSDGDDAPDVIHLHQKHGFTGELDLFSSRKILVSGRMGADGAVLRVPRANFGKLLSAEPDVGDVVMRAFILRRLGLIDNAQGGVVLVGRKNSGPMLSLTRFLRRNGYPLKTLEVDDPETADEARGVLDHRGVGDDELPLVVCSNDVSLRRPTLREVADCLGLTEHPHHKDEAPYDVTVIGAGPAGLAAAVYAASEGLRTIILEAEAPGGQAGTSSRIENYLGFPTGVSGWELAARAQHQAQKFGATLTLPRRVETIACCGDACYRLTLDGGEEVRTRTAVVACGARWRTLDLDNFHDFENRGIHYAATSVEAELCGDSEVIVVGGGNSAGQAAIFLSQHAKRVHLLVRGDSLADSMSDYLLKRIEASDRIDLRYRTEVTGLAGDGWLERVTWTHEGDESEHDIGHVFLMIGAVPNSDWTDGFLCRDSGGFITTGASLAQAEACDWPLDRPPHPLETSRPGIFAVGDVRAGSVKRVASAVGEGSVCVQDLHRVLTEQHGVGA